MSSFTRRIQRQQAPSRRNVVDPFIGKPRKGFFMGRGSKLGVHNPKDKSLLARIAREKRNAARKGGAK